MVTLCCLYLHLAELRSENLESAKSPAQCTSSPGNNMTEQIIEFDWNRTSGPGNNITEQITGDPGRTNGNFCDKTKICKENLRVDYYFRVKYCTR